MPAHLSATVSFPTGGAVLDKTDEIAIEKFLTEVARGHLHVVTVSGFASPEGTPQENALLIFERAASVVHFVRQILLREHLKNIAIVVQTGGIKHLTTQLSDQVATLTA